MYKTRILELGTLHSVVKPFEVQNMSVDQKHIIYPNLSLCKPFSGCMFRSL